MTRIYEIKRANGDALLPGELQADSVLELYYDGVNFRMKSKPAGRGGFLFEFVDLI